jgi:hypothetical protein
MEELSATGRMDLEGVFFHVTLSANVPSIQAQGLVPQAGERSQQMDDRGIFLFASLEEAEDAVMNWLGDEFDDDESLTLLKVTLPAGVRVTQVAFETVCHDPIPADYIDVVGEL